MHPATFSIVVSCAAIVISLATIAFNIWLMY